MKTSTKKSPDALYLLIKALTPNEKRYFTAVFAPRHIEKPKYVKAFRIYNKHSSYNETKLKQKLEEQELIKSFAVTKNNLTKLILQAMRAYHSVKKSIDEELRELLIDETFYYNKGLIEAAQKTLDKAQTLAEEHEKYFLLFEILYRKARLVIEKDSRHILEKIKKIHNELNQALNYLTNTSFYTTHLELFGVIHRTDTDMSNKALAEEAKRILEDPMLKNEENALTFYSKYNLFEIKGLYYRTIGKNDLCYEYRKKIYELWESNKKIRTSNPRIYKIVLANYLHSCSMLGKDEFFTILDKINKLPLKTQNDAGETFQITKVAELFYYINTAKYQEATALMPEIKTGLIKHSAKVTMSKKLNIYYNSILLYLLNEDYEKGRYWIEALISTKVEIRKDLQGMARIFKWIYYFEETITQNDNDRADTLHAIWRSAYRYLLGNEGLDTFKKKTIKYFKTIPDAVNPKEEISIFKTLKQELLVVLKQQTKTPVGLPEIIYWLQSKIVNQPFRKTIEIYDLRKDN